jgi:hypothetical protein
VKDNLSTVIRLQAGMTVGIYFHGDDGYAKVSS